MVGDGPSGNERVASGDAAHTRGAGTREASKSR
jgi:hypothetical protein